MTMEPSDDLILATINKLKNNNAAGIDGICGELMKYGSDELKSCIPDIIKTVWKEEKMPEDWDIAIYVP